MSPVLALDTSVAVPLLTSRHREHATVVRWWSGRPVVLAGHAVVETYSTLTRLPGELRLAPQDAARLMNERFGPPLSLPGERLTDLPRWLADREVHGGAVYDALVGLAAAEHGAELATRDARARRTYEAVGATVVLVPSG